MPLQKIKKSANEKNSSVKRSLFNLKITGKLKGSPPHCLPYHLDKVVLTINHCCISLIQKFFPTTSSELFHSAGIWVHKAVP